MIRYKTDVDVTGDISNWEKIQPIKKFRRLFSFAALPQETGRSMGQCLNIKSRQAWKKNPKFCLKDKHRQLEDGKKEPTFVILGLAAGLKVV